MPTETGISILRSFLEKKKGGDSGCDCLPAGSRQEGARSAKKEAKKWRQL